MFDRELVSAVLGQISETLDVILARTRHMKSSREFTGTPGAKKDSTASACSSSLWAKA